MAKKITVQLYNRTAKLDDSSAQKIRKYFRFRVPNYQFMPSYKYGYWDGYINLMQRGVVSSGLFLALQDEVEKESGYTFEVEDYRERLSFKTAVKSDWGHQNEAEEAMIKSVSGGLIIAGTGTGKTKIAAMYFRRLKGNAVFIVDELHLLEQTIKALEGELKEIVGKIGESVFEPQRITVATIQTLHIHKEDSRYRSWQKKLDVMIIDEVHVALNRRNKEVITKIKPAAIFGLTATLELQKQNVRMNAHAMCGPVIFEYHLEQGTKEGRVTPGIVCAVQYFAEGLNEDYQTEYRELITDNQERNACVLALVREAYKRGKRIALLVERVAHLKSLSESLNDIPHRKLYGAREVEKRIISTEKFDEGKVRLLIANKVFKKGIDVSAIDCMIECSALKSKNDAQQKYGRTVRLGDEKTGVIFFDINDRSFPQYVKDDDGFNRFQLCSKSRLRAFKAKGIPVLKTTWENNAEEIFNLAEERLSKYLKKLDLEVN